MEQIQFHHFTLKKLVAKDEPNLVDLENQAHPGKQKFRKKIRPNFDLKMDFKWIGCSKQII